MPTFEEFEQSLHDLLAHLRNPAYVPPEFVWFILGHKSQYGLNTLQDTIAQTIQSLKPAVSTTSAGLRSQRFYELLSYRYIQQLTQEETAERLGITPRHVRREQQQATHVLARRLWEKRPAQAAAAAEDGLAEQPGQESVAWRTQVREELAALQQSAPGSVVEIATALDGVMKIGQALTSQHGVSLKIEPAEPAIIVAMHPSVLRQVLITAIEKLVRSMPAGQITLAVERSQNRLKLTMTGAPAVTHQPPDSDLIREILAVHGGTVEAYLEEGRVGFHIELPTADKITVLVIDDNADLVHFYKRYTTGTRYQIVHLAEGQQALATIKDTNPDVIILDVMLPDTDGWELLTRLREQPAITTPIIVCSVVRRAELALSLGASLYLPKPVERREFIRALDQVLSQVPAID